jgi:hypothetical protein
VVVSQISVTKKHILQVFASFCNNTLPQRFMVKRGKSVVDGSSPELIHWLPCTWGSQVTGLQGFLQVLCDLFFQLLQTLKAIKSLII